MTTTLVNLKYGYDQASNRLHRLDEVATGLSKNFDERYTYDGLHRLTAFDRGQLDVNGNNLTNATLGQTWGLDPTGNWNSFAQTVTGAFGTTRTHNEANEIEEIDTPTGSPVWFSPPGYDANGNMTEFPQPGAVDDSYTATYDAWNRLVKLENGGTVAEYQYDGLNRRIIKDADSVTRHYYHSDQWQVLEERTDANTTADRQYVWGMRYVDDLILRDHDSTRLYALSDALFNVVALTDEAGDVKERFAYQPYGESEELNPDFTTYSGTDYEWEYRFTGRELDLESGLQLNRNRYLHQQLGSWVTRDPIEYAQSENLYGYAKNSPANYQDPSGLRYDSVTVAIEKCMQHPTPALQIACLKDLIDLYGPKEAANIQRIINSLKPAPPAPPPAPAPVPVPQPAPVPPEKIIQGVVIVGLYCVAKLLEELAKRLPNDPPPPPPPKRETCLSKYGPLVDLCENYDYSSIKELIKIEFPGQVIIKESPATRCTGKHYNIGFNKPRQFVGTALCCACCEDTVNGPEDKVGCNVTDK